jgi:thiol-disulfide isomerase/thioredoxin
LIPRRAQPVRRSRKKLYTTVVAGVVALAVAAVVVAGYVVGADDRQAAAGSSTTGLKETDGSGPVVKLASWSGGGVVALKAPGKPTVLLAIAGWCATCVAPARNLEAIHEEFGDRVQVIAFSVDPGESEETLRGFRKAAGDPGYLWGFDAGGRVAQAFELQYLDTVVVLDSAGKQVHKSVRPSNDKLREILRSALGEPK